MRLRIIICFLLTSLISLPSFGQSLETGIDYVEKCLRAAAPVSEYKYGVPIWSNLIGLDSVSLCNKARAQDPKNLLVQSALSNALYHEERYGDALVILLDLASKNYAPAFVGLGNLYEEGLGADKNFLKAEEYYKQSISAGFEHAKLFRGAMILESNSTEKNRAYGVALIDQVLETNSVAAYLFAYKLYTSELYGVADKELAKEFALKAHKAGNNSGTIFLGTHYLGAEDLHNALKYFEQAFEHSQQVNTTPLMSLEWIIGAIYLEENFEKYSPFQAEKWFLRGHAAGSRDATDMLIKIYAEGVGVERDVAKAIKYIKERAERYNVHFNLSIGHALSGTDPIFGGHFDVDIESAKEAEKYFRAALEVDGDTEALYHLGELYLKQIGWNSKNQKIAFDWHLKGHRSGDLRSTEQLVDLYQWGLGVDQNFDKSLEYAEIYEKGEELNPRHHVYKSLYFDIWEDLRNQGNGGFTGNVEELAQKVINTGELWLEEYPDDFDVMSSISEVKLSQGIGDLSKQWASLEKRASEGNYSYQRLGYLHEYGVYGPVDLRKAMQFYQKAIEFGGDDIEKAYNSLALMYKNGRGVPQNYEKAISLLKRALIINEDDLRDTDGIPTACSCHISRTSLADFYLNGLGVERDPNRAIDLLTSAAEYYSPASFKLGEIYEYGKGVSKDLSKAKYWFARTLRAKRNMKDEFFNEMRRVIGDTQKLAEVRLRHLNDIDTRSEDNIYQLSGNFVALLIAAENYEHMEDLKTPRNDIKEIGTILEDRYGFKTTALYDPTRTDITKKLNQLKTELKEEDTLLIYYAGHGVEDSGDGFWLPVDAQKEDDTNWLANDYLTRKLRTIKATNILLIADSCYSGTLSRGVKIPSSEQNTPASNAIQLYSETKSRVVITSGNLEPVMDGGGGNHSVFARGLLEVLSANRDIITATELYNETSRIVVNDSLDLGKSQTPTIASLNSAGHIGPDVVFYRN